MLSKNEVKYIQSLHHKKGRVREGVFIAEGRKLVLELLQYRPGWLLRLYATPAFFAQWGNQPDGVTYREVTETDLERITFLQTPQEVLAVVQQPPPPPVPLPQTGWVLALDGIRDPGNLGTLIRLADWFGLAGIYCSPDCVEPWNPKTVQASMGSIFRVPIAVGLLQDVLAAESRPAVAAGLSGTLLQQFSFPQTGILVIGNEGQGIRPEVLENITQQVHIPQFGRAESLNAAMAAGIILWEIMRTR